MRPRLVGIDQKLIRFFLQGFLYEIMNYISGERGGRRSYVEDGEVKLGFTLRSYQIYAWYSVMNLLA